MNTLTENQIWGQSEAKTRHWSVDGRLSTEREIFLLCAERGLPATSINEAVNILSAFDFQVRPFDQNANPA